MKQRIVIVLVAMLLPVVAIAQESDKYQCTYGDLQRRIEIAHEPGVQVPCSVHYYKDTEMPGEQQELWSANSDPTYCRNKAKELVTKLEGWGWDCGTQIDAVMETDEPEELLGDPEIEEASDDESKN